MQLDPMERLNMGLSAGAIAASFAVATPHFATSLACGAAIEALNFRFLYRSAQALFGGELANQNMWLAVFGLRFGLLAAGIIAAMVVGADPLGLVLGLSLVMPAAVISAVWNRPPVLDHPPTSPLAPEDPSWERYSIWRAAEVEPADEEVE
jgi:hypothetical protein